MKRVALCTEVNSIYLRNGFDCYDKERGAFSYTDKFPVVAHPPCRAFGRLKYFSHHTGCEIFLALWCVAVVRQCGGILENPKASSLWKLANLPKPGLIDSFGGICIQVNLHDFGFSALKPTWIYIVGISYSSLPALPLNFDAITHVVTSSRKGKTNNRYLPELSYKKRASTPQKMVDYFIIILDLISNARSI